MKLHITSRHEYLPMQEGGCYALSSALLQWISIHAKRAAGDVADKRRGGRQAGRRAGNRTCLCVGAYRPYLSLSLLTSIHHQLNVLKRLDPRPNRHRDSSIPRSMSPQGHLVSFRETIRKKHGCSKTVLVMQSWGWHVTAPSPPSICLSGGSFERRGLL